MKENPTNLDIDKIIKNNLAPLDSSNINDKVSLFSEKYEMKYAHPIKNIGKTITLEDDNSLEGDNITEVSKNLNLQAIKLLESSKELEELLTKNTFSSNPELVKKYVIKLLFYIRQASAAKLLNIGKEQNSKINNDRQRNISNSILVYERLVEKINILLEIKEEKENKNLDLDLDLNNLITKNKKTTSELISSFIGLFTKESDEKTYEAEIVSNLINDGLEPSLKKLENIIGLIKNLGNLRPYDNSKLYYISEIKITGSHPNKKISFKISETKPQLPSKDSLGSKILYSTINIEIDSKGTITTINKKSSGPVELNIATSTTSTTANKNLENIFFICNNSSEIDNILQNKHGERQQDYEIFKKALNEHINLTATKQETINDVIKKVISAAKDRILGANGNEKNANIYHFLKKPLEKAIKKEIEKLEFPKYSQEYPSSYHEKLTSYIKDLNKKFSSSSKEDSGNLYKKVSKGIDRVLEKLKTEKKPQKENKVLNNNYLSNNNNKNNSTKTNLKNNTIKPAQPKKDEIQDEINKIKEELSDTLETFKKEKLKEIDLKITRKIKYAEFIQEAYKSFNSDTDKLPLYAKPEEICGDFYYPFEEQLKNYKDNKVLSAIQNVGLALSKTQVSFLKEAISKIRGKGNILEGQFSVDKTTKKCFTIPFYAEAGAGKTFTLEGFNKPRFSTNLDETAYKDLKEKLSEALFQKKSTELDEDKTGKLETVLSNFIALEEGKYKCSLSLLIQNLLPPNSQGNANFTTINLNYHQSKEEIKSKLEEIRKNAEIGTNYFLSIDEAHNYQNKTSEYEEKLKLIKNFQKEYNESTGDKRGIVAIIEATATPDLLTQQYKNTKYAANDNNNPKKEKARKAEEEIKRREQKVQNIKKYLELKEFNSKTHNKNKVNLIIDPSLPGYDGSNITKEDRQWKAIFEEAKTQGRHVAIQYKNEKNDTPSYRFFLFSNSQHNPYAVIEESQNTEEGHRTEDFKNFPKKFTINGKETDLKDILKKTNLIYDKNNYTGGDFQIGSNWPENGSNIIIRNLKVLEKDYGDPSLISEDVIQMLRRFRPFNFDKKESYQSVFVEKNKESSKGFEQDSEFYKSLKSVQEKQNQISLNSLEKFFQQKLEKNKKNSNDYFDLNLAAQLFVCLEKKIISDEDAKKHIREYALANHLLSKGYDSTQTNNNLSKVTEFNEKIKKFQETINKKEQEDKGFIDKFSEKIKEIKTNKENKDTQVVKFSKPSFLNSESSKSYLKIKATVKADQKKIKLDTIIVGSEKLFIANYTGFKISCNFFQLNTESNKTKEINFNTFQTKAEELANEAEKFAEEVKNKNLQKTLEELSNNNSKKKSEANNNKNDPSNQNNKEKQKSNEEKIDELKNAIKEKYNLSDNILAIEALKKIIEKEAQQENPSAENVISQAQSSDPIKDILLEKFKLDLEQILGTGTPTELLTDGKIDAKNLKEGLSNISIELDGAKNNKVFIGHVLNKLGDEKLKILAIGIFSSVKDKQQENKQEILNALGSAVDLLRKEKEKELRKIEEAKKKAEELRKAQKAKEEAKKKEEDKRRNYIKQVLRENHGFTVDLLNVDNSEPILVFNIISSKENIFQEPINKEVVKDDYNTETAVKNVLDKVVKNQENKNKEFFSRIFWSDVNKILTKNNKGFFSLVLLNTKKVDISNFSIPENGKLPADYKTILNTFKDQQEIKELAKQVFLSDTQTEKKEVSEKVVTLLNEIKKELDKKKKKDDEEKKIKEEIENQKNHIKKVLKDDHGFRVDLLSVDNNGGFFGKENIFLDAINEEVKESNYTQNIPVEKVLEEVVKNQGSNFFANIFIEDLKKLLTPETNTFTSFFQKKNPALLNENKVGNNLKDLLINKWQKLAKDDKFDNKISDFIEKLKNNKNFTKLPTDIFLSNPSEDTIINNQSKIIGLFDEVIKEISGELKANESNDESDGSEESNYEKESEIRFKSDNKFNITNQEVPEKDENIEKQEKENLEALENNLKERGSYTTLEKIDKNLESNLKGAVKNIKDFDPNKAANKIISDSIKEDLNKKELSGIFSKNLTDILNKEKPVSEPNLLNDKKININYLENFLKNVIKENDLEKKDDNKITSEQFSDYLNKNQDKFQEVAGEILGSKENEQKKNLELIENALNQIVKEEEKPNNTLNNDLKNSKIISESSDSSSNSEKKIDPQNLKDNPSLNKTDSIIPSDATKQKQDKFQEYPEIKKEENDNDSNVKKIKDEEKPKEKTKKTTEESDPASNDSKESEKSTGSNGSTNSINLNKKKDLKNSEILSENSVSKSSDFCNREKNNDEAKEPQDIKIGFLRLRDFTIQIQTSKITNNFKSDDINFCYVLEPDDSSKTEEKEIINQIKDGSKISPKLIIKQDERNAVCVSTVSGKDFKVSYGKGKDGDNKVKDGIINSTKSIANGNVVQEQLNKLIKTEFKDKLDTTNKTLKTSIDINKIQIPTIPKFPISFKEDGDVCYSINLLKSNDQKNINVVFMTPRNIDDIPDDASNVQYIHIPGTGVNGNTSYKAKVELILDDTKKIGGKIYKKGEVAIYPDPLEIKEGKPVTAVAGKDYTKAKELMSKMKITAMRQIGYCRKENNKKKNHVEIESMTFLTEGEKGKDGKIFNINLKSMNLSIDFDEVTNQKEEYKDNTKLLGAAEKLPSPIMTPKSIIQLNKIGNKEIITAAIRGSLSR